MQEQKRAFVSVSHADHNMDPLKSTAEFVVELAKVGFQITAGPLTIQSLPLNKRELKIEEANLVKDLLKGRIGDFNIPFNVVVCPIPEKTEVQSMEQVEPVRVFLLAWGARNYERCAVITDLNQYNKILGLLRNGGITLQERRRLAIEAIDRINDYLGKCVHTLCKEEQEEQE
ncbi:MAG: hypothetical protein HYS87_02320 [Candidatus Colwellbacteria bacterium]|nr:hypothetical protein [Candidatus Colwellbacteria bacterium]